MEKATREGENGTSNDRNPQGKTDMRKRCGETKDAKALILINDIVRQNTCNTSGAGRG
jgi:hypothetical protein